MAVKRKSLPTGFRYLFTRKEIKVIEAEIGLKFQSIINGNITHSQKFEKDAHFQCFLHPLRISATLDDGWAFSMLQEGLRNELIPEELDAEFKQLATKIIRNYVHKIRNSKETDLLNQPELWINAFISDYQLNVSSREEK